MANDEKDITTIDVPIPTEKVSSPDEGIPPKNAPTDGDSSSSSSQSGDDADSGKSGAGVSSTTPEPNKSTIGDDEASGNQDQAVVSATTELKVKGKLIEDDQDSTQGQMTMGATEPKVTTIDSYNPSAAPQDAIFRSSAPKDAIFRSSAPKDAIVDSSASSHLPNTSSAQDSTIVQIEYLTPVQKSLLESLEQRRSLLLSDEKEIYERFDSIESYLLTYLGVYIGAIVGLLGLSGGGDTVDARHRYSFFGVLTLGLVLTIGLTLLVGSQRLSDIRWKRFMLRKKKEELLNIANTLKMEIVDPCDGISTPRDTILPQRRLEELTISLKRDRGLCRLVGGPVVVLLVSISLMILWTTSLRRGNLDFVLFREPHIVLPGRDHHLDLEQ